LRGREIAQPELAHLFGGQLQRGRIATADYEAVRVDALVAFAGIAKPWKVERALDTAGAELVDFAPFPDHAAFREDDLRFLADRAERAHARLVTTEKDWFRLPPEWRARVLSWPVKASFEDEAAFQRLLLGAVRAHSAR
jgi:tetraacyldisaccharide 4'-kinase